MRKERKGAQKKKPILIASSTSRAFFSLALFFFVRPRKDGNSIKSPGARSRVTLPVQLCLRHQAPSLLSPLMSFLRRFFFFFLRMGNHHSNPDWTWKVLMECFNPSADSVVWALSPPFCRSVDDVNLRPGLRVYPTRKHARTRGVLSVTGPDTHTKNWGKPNNCFLLFELPICRISLVKEEEKGRKIALT